MTTRSESSPDAGRLGTCRGNFGLDGHRRHDPHEFDKGCFDWKPLAPESDEGRKGLACEECGHVESSHFSAEMGSFCKECPPAGHVWEHVFKTAALPEGAEPPDTKHGVSSEELGRIHNAWFKPTEPEAERSPLPSAAEPMPCEHRMQYVDSGGTWCRTCGITLTGSPHRTSELREKQIGDIVKQAFAEIDNDPIEAATWAVKLALKSALPSPGATSDATFPQSREDIYCQRLSLLLNVHGDLFAKEFSPHPPLSDETEPHYSKTSLRKACESAAREWLPSSSDKSVQVRDLSDAIEKHVAPEFIKLLEQKGKS